VPGLPHLAPPVPAGLPTRRLPADPPAAVKPCDTTPGPAAQVVTYKWVGRNFNVPYDTAKRILFEFLTRHGQVGMGGLSVCMAAGGSCLLGVRWASRQQAARRHERGQPGFEHTLHAGSAC